MKAPIYGTPNNTKCWNQRKNSKDPPWGCWSQINRVTRALLFHMSRQLPDCLRRRGCVIGENGVIMLAYKILTFNPWNNGKLYIWDITCWVLEFFFVRQYNSGCTKQLWKIEQLAQSQRGALDKFIFLCLLFVLNLLIIYLPQIEKFKMLWICDCHCMLIDDEFS